MNTSAISKSCNAIAISFTANEMIIFLEDGRELAVPLVWFSSLQNATIEQLSDWRFIGNGEGIHWNEIDEDILIENLL